MTENAEVPKKRIGVIGFFGFFRKADEVSNDLLQALLRGIMDENEFEVKAVYSAYGKKGRLHRKLEFQEVIKACSAPEIGLLVVNTADVFPADAVKVLSYTQGLKENYGTETYFIQEDTCSLDNQFPMHLTYRNIALDHFRRKRKRTEQMKKAHQEITEGRMPKWIISCSGLSK